MCIRDRVLDEMTPDQVIQLINASGLRGRGGAGFPTGRKWGFAQAAKSVKKYVICNGDEGDPGAFMDRSVMEGDPHKVIEDVYKRQSPLSHMFCATHQGIVSA